MKKFILGALVASVVALTGCTPTAEQVNKTSTAIGYAAGLVANQTEIKADARNAIVYVLGEVRSCVPESGESFVDAWTPVINAKVAELVAAGKIDLGTGEIVKTVAVLAAKAVDYLFDVRFPKAKQYEELVRAGVSGAIDGFLEVFKPADARARGEAITIKPDEEAYKYFKMHR